MSLILPRRAALFRDPVHDIIAFDAKDAADSLLLRLVESPEFQRLRRIRQLALAYLVYHGAEHSRFAHSLGVAHVSRRMLAQVALVRDMSEEEQLITTAAALLHDVGHGPFSHAIEHVTHIRHEEVSTGLLLDPDTTIHGVLHDVDPTLPAKVANAVDGKGEKSFTSAIVSSQLDADRMDYILRDGLFTGVKIGVYDVERILSMLEVDDSNRLVVNERAREAVEGYLLARFHMFKQVYFHKAVRAAETMLELVLARAKELIGKGHVLDIPSPNLERMLSGDALSPLEFIELDDTDIWLALKCWTRADDALLAELSHGLLFRKLYKTVELKTKDDNTVLLEEARKAIADAGGDPTYHVLLDTAEDTPYRPYGPHGKSPILIQLGDRLAPIEDCSSLAGMLGQDSYRVQRLIVHADYVEIAEKVAGSFIGSLFSPRGT